MMTRTKRCDPSAIRVCFPFVGDSIGGSHLSTLLLIEGLDHGRYEPAIVVHEEGPLAELLRERRIPFELLPLSVYAGGSPNMVSIVAGMLRNAPRLAAHIRRHDIDIVHGNDLRMNLTWSAATKLTGRPFVWHQRALPYSSSTLWRGIDLLSDHVVHISGVVAQAMPATSRTPASIIPNPVAPPEGAPSREDAKHTIAQELGLDPETKIVGLVGRLVQCKRPDIFVAASARLAQRVSNIDFAFVILGHDEEGLGPDLRKLARSMGIEGQVYFAGFRHSAEEWIRGMDLLMATSERESFGRTLIEAMALGTPVVASRAGGHVEIIDHRRTGILVPPNDPDAFAAAALRILTDPGLADRLSEAGKTCALERYSVERHAERVSSVYVNLMQRGGVAARATASWPPK